MQYKCATLSFTGNTIGPKGVIESLCTSCKTCDCDNNVQNIKVSILGVNKNWRVIFRGDEPYRVTGCEGYTK